MELPKLTPTALPLLTGMCVTSVQAAAPAEHVGVAVGLPATDVTVRVGVSGGDVGVAVPQTAGAGSNSTRFVTVVAVLKPSATRTRPSGSWPCACPARFVIIDGPALKVLVEIL